MEKEILTKMKKTMKKFLMRFKMRTKKTRKKMMKKRRRKMKLGRLILTMMMLFHLQSQVLVSFFAILFLLTLIFICKIVRCFFLQTLQVFVRIRYLKGSFENAVRDTNMISLSSPVVRGVLHR